jgi:hypothetical protein
MDFDYLYHQRQAIGVPFIILIEIFVTYRDRFCLMQAKQNFPYPTFVQAVRYIAKVTDSKNSNKKLDDKAFGRAFDYREIKAHIEEVIAQPLAKYVDLHTSKVVTEFLEESFKKYAAIVGNICADGLDREEMLFLLMKGFVRNEFATFVLKLSDNFPGPNPVTLFSNNGTAVSTVLNWVEKHEAGWTHFLKGLEKEQKDRISAWVRGSDLPSSQFIYLLQTWSKGPWPEHIDWQRVRVLLFLGRAIDHIKKDEVISDLIDEVRVALWNPADQIDLPKEILNIQRQYQKKIADILPHIGMIQNGLKRTNPKKEGDEERFRKEICHVRSYLKEKAIYRATEYWLDWHDARWHVLSGDLEKANEHYKSAFYDCLFRAGVNQKIIIEEAFVVGASVVRPDKVFLKHLKCALLTFKYDIPSVINDKPSIKFTDSIENWELELWKSNFSTIFPPEGFFPGIEIRRPNSRKGPLLIPVENDVNPDYRYPDRKIKIGETWKKLMPQLIYFLLQEKYEIASNLIDRGANVNVFTDTDDTPVSVALEIMNVTNVPYNSLDDRFFEIISCQRHELETINKCTQKKRLLPIISAVETGSPVVVKKVLGLGADPNGRGMTDRQTALNVCLKRIGMVKNPEYFFKHQQEMPYTPEVLDSIRRHTNGIFGFTLDQQSQSMSSYEHHPLFKKLKESFPKLTAERVTKFMPVNHMREIARILIEAGADINAEHTSPIRGYTPLMLAAELDEGDLFEYMLTKEGDPFKYYIHPETKEKVDCLKIANYFESRQVLEVLKGIRS